jgi:hypothetical protein
MPFPRNVIVLLRHHLISRRAYSPGFPADRQLKRSKVRWASSCGRRPRPPIKAQHGLPYTVSPSIPFAPVALRVRGVVVAPVRRTRSGSSVLVVSQKLRKLVWLREQHPMRMRGRRWCSPCLPARGGDSGSVTAAQDLRLVNSVICGTAHPTWHQLQTPHILVPLSWSLAAELAPSRLPYADYSECQMGDTADEGQ